MINQKINLELLSGSTTTLAASRSVFQTVVVLKIHKKAISFPELYVFSNTRYFDEKGNFIAREY